jgi:hypothetical protein
LVNSSNSSSLVWAQSAYPPPESFDSSISYPAPSDGVIKFTETPVEKVIVESMSINVTVEGLVGNDKVDLQILPDIGDVTEKVTTSFVEFPPASIVNESKKINLQAIPVGTYKLVISAPPQYFRNPKGYLFQVFEGGMISTSRESLHFELISPSEQELPPCRDRDIEIDSTYSETSSSDNPIEKPAICFAEHIVDLSAPIKYPEPHEQGSATKLSTDYHYAGPVTSYNVKGILGRNYVVNPSLIHGGAHQFIAERVYARNGSNWIEAGWAEVSWRDDRQYIYQFDGTNKTWNWFDQYDLSSGTPVRTMVKSDGNNYWIADLYWNGNYQRLAREAMDLIRRT